MIITIETLSLNQTFLFPFIYQKKSQHITISLGSKIAIVKITPVLTVVEILKKKTKNN